MRWPWSPRPRTPEAPPAAAAGAPSAPPVTDWAAMPPIGRQLRADGVVRPLQFARALGVRQPLPRAVQTLSHDVTPVAPRGGIDGLVVALHPSAVQRSADAMPASVRRRGVRPRSGGPQPAAAASHVALQREEQSDDPGSFELPEPWAAPTVPVDAVPAPVTGRLPSLPPARRLDHVAPVEEASAPAVSTGSPAVPTESLAASDANGELDPAPAAGAGHPAAPVPAAFEPEPASAAHTDSAPRAGEQASAADPDRSSLASPAAAVQRQRPASGGSDLPVLASEPPAPAEPPSAVPGVLTSGLAETPAPARQAATPGAAAVQRERAGGSDQPATPTAAPTDGANSPTLPAAQTEPAGPAEPGAPATPTVTSEDAPATVWRSPGDVEVGGPAAPQATLTSQEWAAGPGSARPAEATPLAASGEPLPGPTFRFDAPDTRSPDPAAGPVAPPSAAGPAPGPSASVATAAPTADSDLPAARAPLVSAASRLGPAQGPLTAPHATVQRSAADPAAPRRRSGLGAPLSGPAPTPARPAPPPPVAQLSPASAPAPPPPIATGPAPLGPVEPHTLPELVASDPWPASEVGRPVSALQRSAVAASRTTPGGPGSAAGAGPGPAAPAASAGWPGLAAPAAADPAPASAPLLGAGPPLASVQRQAATSALRRPAMINGAAPAPPVGAWSDTVSAGTPPASTYAAQPGAALGPSAPSPSGTTAPAEATDPSYAGVEALTGLTIGPDGRVALPDLSATPARAVQRQQDSPARALSVASPHGVRVQRRIEELPVPVQHESAADPPAGPPDDAPAAAPDAVAGSTAPSGSPAAPTDLDAAAEQIYERLRPMLEHDLLRERERSSLLLDL